LNATIRTARTMAIDTTYLFITLVSKNSLILAQLTQSAKTGPFLHIEYQIHPKTQAFPTVFDVYRP
jgi:hypothetical protein